MKSLFRFLVLILLLTGWSLAALSLHVVRTPGTVADVPVIIVTKDRLGINDIYVDTTRWTMEDVSRHPAVVERLIESGRADALRHVVGADATDIAQQLSDAIGRDRQNTSEDESAGRLARRAGFRWPWEK